MQSSHTLQKLATFYWMRQAPFGGPVGSGLSYCLLSNTPSFTFENSDIRTSELLAYRTLLDKPLSSRETADRRQKSSIILIKIKSADLPSKSLVTIQNLRASNRSAVNSRLFS